MNGYVADCQNCWWRMEADSETVDQLKEQAANHRDEEGHVVAVEQPREKPFISIEKVERIIESVTSGRSGIEKGVLTEVKNRVRSEANDGESREVRHLPVECIDISRGS